jgi:trehalose 6-phosphate phosphatase
MTKIDPAAGQLQLLAGRKVFEIAPRGLDKGKAIARFMAEPPFRGRAPVFIGDDEIDRAAFDAALELGGLAFSVGVEIPGLSGVFAGPGAVRDWLHGLGR